MNREIINTGAGLVVKEDIPLPPNAVEHLDNHSRFRPAGVDLGEQTNIPVRQVRSSYTSFFDDDDWVAQYIKTYVDNINEEVIKWDLSHHYGRLQYAYYGPGDHYNWHQDAIRNKPGRKLSFSFVLNDQFTGGEFEIASINYGFDLTINTEVIPTVPGTLIVFPATTPHRVKPVKSGLRKSVVGWIHGPPLR